MSLIIRLYPRSWRERYGDELSALLEDRPLGLADALDLLLGAFDAHIHFRAPGARSAAEVRPLTLPRLGAQAATAGGVLWLMTFAIAMTEDPAMADPLMTILSLNLSLFVVGLVGLSSARAGSHHRLVWAALPMPAIGVALLSGGAIAQVVVGDRLLIGELTPYAFWMGGMVLALVGSIVFGALSAASGALPRWAAGMLSVGALVQLVTIVATDHGRDEWLVLMGAVAFGLSWISVGLGEARTERYRVAGQDGSQRLPVDRGDSGPDRPDR